MSDLYENVSVHVHNCKISGLRICVHCTNQINWFCFDTFFCWDEIQVREDLHPLHLVAPEPSSTPHPLLGTRSRLRCSHEDKFNRRYSIYTVFSVLAWPFVFRCINLMVCHVGSWKLWCLGGCLIKFWQPVAATVTGGCVTSLAAFS